MKVDSVSGTTRRISVKRSLVLIVLMASTAGSAAAQQPVRLMGAPCTATTAEMVTEPKTGRTYMLDYPCDLKAGEKVTFILSLHGGGSSHTWQRQYFPAYDYKDKYRLVIATPFSPTRSWSAADDQYLQNIVTSVVQQVGPKNVQAFWLAGHSQGGMTSRRLICTDFFKSKVDGFLSVSGGRLGGAPARDPGAGRPPAPGQQAAAPPAAPAAQPAEPTCDFSHIFEVGQHEIVSLPATSAVAQKYNCSARVKRDDIVDTKPGYVYASGSQNPGTKQWGLLPRPGTAEMFVYPNCSAGHVVADFMRMDKGHTEGLEPRVTEELVKTLVSARGGKIQGGSPE
jgi:pimeloyl-ACP methyl ester carboxylesterase